MRTRAAKSLPSLHGADSARWQGAGIPMATATDDTLQQALRAKRAVSHDLTTLSTKAVLRVAVGDDSNAAAATVDAANWRQPDWPFAEDPELERRVDALLATMTVEEKVGQIIRADIDCITPDDVREYRLGSILAGGGSDPGGQYNAPPQAWVHPDDAFWEASMDTSGGGKAIPTPWGVDAMHGQSDIVGATLFPHNIGLGATATWN